MVFEKNKGVLEFIRVSASMRFPRTIGFLLNSILALFQKETASVVLMQWQINDLKVYS
jgi:hypothetical protein